MSNQMCPICGEYELTLYCRQCGDVNEVADMAVGELVRRAGAALAWLDDSVQLSDGARAYAARRLREALENVERK